MERFYWKITDFDREWTIFCQKFVQNLWFLVEKLHFWSKIKPRSEKVMLLKFWTTLSTTDSSNSILIFIFATAKVFWYIRVDVEFIEAAILIVFSVEMCDFELKKDLITGHLK